MKKNMSTADRAIRILIATIIAVLYFTNSISGGIAIVLGIFSVIFVITSSISFCPLYKIFGINTCKKKN